MVQEVGLPGELAGALSVPVTSQLPGPGGKSRELIVYTQLKLSVHVPVQCAQGTGLGAHLGPVPLGPGPGEQLWALT